LEGKNVRLAVSWPDLRQDYHAKTKQILEELTKQLGWTLVAAGADNDAAKQLADAENLLAAKPDILFFQGIDAASALPMIEAAKAAGIPVVDMYSKSSTTATLSGATASMIEDPYEEGKFQGNLLVKTLGDKIKGMKVLDVAGSPGEFAQGRAQGAEDVLTAAGAIILARQYGDWTRQTSQSVAETMLTAHPDAQMIIGGNDDAALGGMLAAESQGLDPTKMAISGIDGTADAMDAICQGKMIADAGQLYTTKANDIINLTKRILCGETNIPAALPTTIEITSANVKEVAQTIGHTVPEACVPNALLGP
jgi:ribose transport system substrate-binding protein